MAEATETRKTEHGEFLTFQTENNAALQLIEKAKNRLSKFYRPNLYKEEPKQDQTVGVVACVWLCLRYCWPC